MLAFSNDYYGMIFRATQSVELFCAYALVADGVRIGKNAVVGSPDSEHIELVAKRVKGAE